MNKTTNIMNIGVNNVVVYLFYCTCQFMIVLVMLFSVVGCSNYSNNDSYTDVAQNFAEQIMTGSSRRSIEITEVTNFIFSHDNKQSNYCATKPEDYYSISGGRGSEDAFEYRHVRDSLSGDGKVAWVWFTNGKNSCSEQWVVRLIYVNEKWLVDLPIVR